MSKRFSDFKEIWIKAEIEKRKRAMPLSVEEEMLVNSMDDDDMVSLKEVNLIIRKRLYEASKGKSAIEIEKEVRKEYEKISPEVWKELYIDYLESITED